MAEPFLTIVATVRQPGKRPVRLAIDSARIDAPSRAEVDRELIDCFAKLKPEVRAELGHGDQA